MAADTGKPPLFSLGIGTGLFLLSVDMLHKRVDLMSYEFILAQMAHDKPRELVCYDDQFNYYEMGCLGYYLMFRKNRYKDGRRCYYLTNELAMLLGFESLYQMHYCLTGLQYWRRFVSVERLRVALKGYHKQIELLF